MKSLLVLCSVLALGLVASAAETARKPIEYARVDLRDGRRLEHVVVKSYDAASGKVLLVTAGKAITVPIDQFPAPVSDELKSGAPKSGETVSTFSPTKPTPSEPDPANASEPATPPRVQIVRPKPMVMQPTTPAPVLPSSTATPAPATPAPPDVAAHKQAALSRAEKYYRYEHQMGSNSIKVSSLDFEADEPQPVPGWPGRFRTEGKAFIEYYDSKGNSFQRTTSTFDVVTEQKPGEALRVESFSRKS